jgi:colanic acid/amylovoran biosynthesis protein
VKIYFAGQDNFGNRGCEALIRANVKTIRLVASDAQFLVPTKDLLRDSKQWPKASEQGVSFIAAEPMPMTIRWWSRAKRILPWIAGLPPKFSLSKNTRDAIQASDVLIMTGGDIISLEYGLEALYYWKCICEYAMQIGKPTVLWAGSIGPFSSQSRVEKVMMDFLKRFSLITVREEATLRYMQTLGVDGVKLVADPAFALDPEPFEHHLSLFADRSKPILGFNISPLIRKFRDSKEGKDKLDIEVISFLRELLREGKVRVLLIPHVDPLGGEMGNSDYSAYSDSHYMKTILDTLRQEGFHAELDMLPSLLNASQLKYVIGQCDYFMGARTHATIAALSQAVPTTSIAYSIKAKGINHGLFGHLDYVLETPKVTQQSLRQHFDLLERDRVKISNELQERLPKWKQDAGKSAHYLFDEILDR